MANLLRFTTISPQAKGSVASVRCVAVGSQSISETVPDMNVQTGDATIAHEATVGQIGEESVLFDVVDSEQAAHALVVNGFIEQL